MPVGFKNGTNGNLDVALNAMQSAYQPHRFIGIDQESRTSILQTRGNPYGHVVLRGGTDGPNYDSPSVKKAEDAISKAGLRPSIMIDCNHANSGKDPFKQEVVLNNLIQQIEAENQSIMGLMIESNLKAGNQTHQTGVPLQYGVSITDKCLDWKNTERIVLKAHQQLKQLSR